MNLYDLLSGRMFLGGQKNPTTLIDMLGSPATAGTDAEPLARLGALAYGGYMAGAGALGGALGAGSGGAYAAGPYGGFSNSAIGATNYGAGAAGTGSQMGNYLQMANLGMGLMGRRGQQPQQTPVTPRPRQPTQPNAFANNSPYIRLLAMRGLLRNG